MARVRRDIDSRFRDMSQRELTDYIHKMGKVANTRLRELEKTKHGKLYKSSSAYRYVEKQARFEREQGQTFVYGVAKDGSFKFNTSTRNVDVRSLQERATQISRFLSARSSTVTGTKAIYEQSYKTYKENNPNYEGSFSEWAEGFSYAILNNYREQYGSKEYERLMLKAKAYNMSNDDIANMLYDVGFREDTDYYKANPDKPISLSDIYDKMEEYRKGNR